MNKYVLSVAIFPMCLTSLMQASDRKTIFKKSISSHATVQSAKDSTFPLPSYEEYMQSVTAVVPLSLQVKTLRQENDAIKHKVLILREWAAQFKTGRDVLQDLDNDKNSFSEQNLPTIMDPVKVQDRGVVHVDATDQLTLVKALLVERYAMANELQALNRWEYYFNLGRAAACRKLQNKK